MISESQAPLYYGTETTQQRVLISFPNWLMKEKLTRDNLWDHFLFPTFIDSSL